MVAWFSIFICHKIYADMTTRIDATWRRIADASVKFLPLTIASPRTTFCLYNKFPHERQYMPSLLHGMSPDPALLIIARSIHSSEMDSGGNFNFSRFIRSFTTARIVYSTGASRLFAILPVKLRPFWIENQINDSTKWSKADPSTFISSIPISLSRQT